MGPSTNGITIGCVMLAGSVKPLEAVRAVALESPFIEAATEPVFCNIKMRVCGVVVMIVTPPVVVSTVTAAIAIKKRG